MKRTRKLVNTYWILAVIAVLLSSVMFVFTAIEMRGSGMGISNALAYTFREGAYLLAFGVTLECLLFICGYLNPAKSKVGDGSDRGEDKE